MGDILSAASLLLTIVTVFYALWYPELIKAIDKKVPTHREDRSGPLSEINKILLSRAIPLFLSSFVVSIIFMPDAIDIIVESINREDGVIYKYNSVKMAICIVVFFAIGITIHSGNMLIKIINKRIELKR